MTDMSWGFAPRPWGAGSQTPQGLLKAPKKGNNVIFNDLLTDKNPLCLIICHTFEQNGYRIRKRRKKLPQEKWILNIFAKKILFSDY